MDSQKMVRGNSFHGSPMLHDGGSRMEIICATGERSSRSRCSSDLEEGVVEAIEGFYDSGDSSYSVTGVKDNSGREIEPIPTETLQCLSAPIVPEVMLFEKLDQVE